LGDPLGFGRSARTVVAILTEQDRLSEPQLSLSIFSPAGLAAGADVRSQIPELFSAAIARHQAGELDAAEKIYRRVLAIHPGHADSLHLLGVVAHQLHRSGEAVALIRKAIAINGSVAGYHANLGVALKDQGKLDEAIVCYRRALELKPDLSATHYNLGNALRAQGELAAAVQCYGRALDLKPEYPEARGNLLASLHDLGRELHDRGNLTAAVAVYRRALDLAPDMPRTHYNLGVALEDQGKLDEAIACYRRALDLDPDLTEADNNLGNVLKDQGKQDQAAAHYRKAITLRPDDAHALYNLGLMLHEQERLDDAIACYRRALIHAPEDASAHLSLALALLAQGNFAQGLPEYEWRWRTSMMSARDLAAPRWTGQGISGQTILLHAEQGYGDTLQFARYAPLAARRGARVILQVPAPLTRLMHSLQGVSLVIADGDDLPAIDFHCPLMSLPFVLATEVATIPGTTPYLAAAPSPSDHWRRRLAELPGLKVGLVWAGASRPFHRVADAIDRKRSLTLDRFAECARIPGVTLISLQKGEPAAQVAAAPAGMAIQDWTDELEDFADTAALVDALDLVIGVDTSVIHLAGALGRPVWMLNRFDSCWRWLRGRDDSPWYPTLSQFRQTAPGDWDSVLTRVRDSLERYALQS
jgi:tetratricopeptide (TPR) repeat protein